MHPWKHSVNSLLLSAQWWTPEAPLHSPWLCWWGPVWASPRTAAGGGRSTGSRHQNPVPLCQRYPPKTQKQPAHVNTVWTQISASEPSSTLSVLPSWNQKTASPCTHCSDTTAYSKLYLLIRRIFILIRELTGNNCILFGGGGYGKSRDTHCQQFYQYYCHLQAYKVTHDHVFSPAHSWSRHFRCAALKPESSEWCPAPLDISPGRPWPWSACGSCRHHLGLGSPHYLPAFTKYNVTDTLGSPNCLPAIAKTMWLTHIAAGLQSNHWTEQCQDWKKKEVLCHQASRFQTSNQNGRDIILSSWLMFYVFLIGGI